MSGRTNGLSPEILRAFSVLELSDSADFATVRIAYRELAKVWHPDRFEGDVSTQRRAQEKLKQINGAYQVLEIFFDQQADPISLRGISRSQKSDLPAKTVPESSESGQHRASEQVNKGPRLMAVMVFVAIVIFVLVASQPSEKLVNREAAQIPSVATPPATAPIQSESTESATAVRGPALAQPGIQERRGPLTQEEKDLIVKYHFNLNPKEWDYDGDKPVRKKLQPQPLQLPDNVKFVIMTEGEMYYTEKEPKPFGSGFKLTDVLRKIDVVVTGKIQIIKVQPPKN
jgi:hypothetical protein